MNAAQSMEIHSGIRIVATADFSDLAGFIILEFPFEASVLEQ